MNKIIICRNNNKSGYFYGDYIIIQTEKEENKRGCLYSKTLVGALYNFCFRPVIISESIQHIEVLLELPCSEYNYEAILNILKDTIPEEFI